MGSPLIYAPPHPLGGIGTHFLPRLYLRGRNRRGMGSPSISAPNQPAPPPPPHTTIRHTMCHLLCGGFFLSLFPRLPFNYAIIKSGQRDKNKTLRVLFLRKNKGPLCEARIWGGDVGGSQGAEKKIKRARLALYSILIIRSFQHIVKFKESPKYVPCLFIHLIYISFRIFNMDLLIFLVFPYLIYLY